MIRTSSPLHFRRVLTADFIVARDFPNLLAPDAMLDVVAGQARRPRALLAARYLEIIDDVRNTIHAAC